MRPSLVSVLVASAIAFLGQACDCSGDHHESSHHEGESEGEHSGEGEAEPTVEHEGEAPATPVGPLGWTAVVESETGEDEYVEHRLLIWRTGPATGDRPDSMEELGHFSNWAGDYTLYVAGSEEAREHPITLLGVRGACATTATRSLHLRVHFEPHHGDAEERLYDGLEFEGCDGPYAFGVSGELEMTELSTRTMDTPPPEVAAVVHDREQQITDDSGDEPMRLVGREIPSLHVWVLSGWETYVVRGDAIVTHTEDSVIGAVTIGDRTMLVMRGSDGVELRIPADDHLERVDPDADPSAEEDAHAPEEH